MLHGKHMNTHLQAYINLAPILITALLSSRKRVKLESENHGVPLFFEIFFLHDECSTY